MGLVKIYGLMPKLFFVYLQNVYVSQPRVKPMSPRHKASALTIQHQVRHIMEQVEYKIAEQKGSRLKALLIYYMGGNKLGTNIQRNQSAVTYIQVMCGMN
jgi:hypothetical protein